MDEVRVGIAHAHRALGDDLIEPAPTAHALVWMNERTLYMASVGEAPMALGDDLAESLAAIWCATLYGRPD